MNKKFNIATLMLVTSLAFTGCANDTNKEADKANETAVEQKANETIEQADQADKTEEKTEESKEGEVKEDKAAEENKEEEKTEDKKSDEEKNEDTETSETPAVEGNIVLHRAYPDEASRSFTTVVVATSGDKIVDAFIDEYQYFGDDEGYQGVPNSDKEFGDGAKEGRILASKIDNKEPYSETMKQAGGEVTLMDNYNAVTDFVKGKTIAELEEVINDDDEKIMDAISGATFKSTPNLLRYIVDAAKDNSFIIGGQAENPENIELRYVLGAPHGDKSFANAVVAVEDEKIIAASIDEYQYIEEGVTSQGEGSDFANDYKDSKTVLSSKLENDDLYSKLMAEKAGSTVTIKENFEAIEKFVAGKTIDEIKETIAGAKEGEKVEAVSGATLVDTAGYLQLIVDAFENPINK